MPMMALVNPVYDCLFRLAQPDSLRKEEEVSVGKKAANAPVVVPGTSKKHSPGRGCSLRIPMQRRAASPLCAGRRPAGQEGLQRRGKQGGGAGCDSLTQAVCLPSGQLFSILPKCRHWGPCSPAIPRGWGCPVLSGFTSHHLRKTQTMTLPCFHRNQLLFQQPSLPTSGKAAVTLTCKM